MKKRKPFYYEDYSYEDYDWHEPILQGELFKGNKTERTEKETEWWGKEWSGYEKTGIWKGYNYYAKPTLDYKYVEQMANALSAKYNIEVRTGRGWSSDVEKKILTYDPLSLITGTKAQLLNSLAHELGHINYTSPSHEITWGKMYEKYQKRGAKGLLNLFEDFRVDYLVNKDFTRDYGELTAQDILSENLEIVRELSVRYQEHAENIKEQNIRYVERAIRTENLENDPLFTELFGKDVKTLKEVSEKLEKVKEKILARETLFDYCASMILDYYEEPYSAPPKLQEYIDKTKPFVKGMVEQKTFQGLVNILETKILPVVEPLLKELEEGFEALRTAFKGGTIAKDAMGRTLSGGYDNVDNILQNEKNRRRSGSGKAMPQEWLDGDYSSLRDSVATSIGELTRKLTFLKRNEETTRYLPQQKSGRLVLKGLYRQRLGDRKLFKKQVETQRVLTSFAFSVMVDISGSMGGEPLIHSVRGMVMLAEVFDKLSIPFEVMAFGNEGKIVKGFEEPIKTKQKALGGLITHTEGNTNLYDALEKTTIGKRSEKNRVVVILSDGGVAGYKDMNWHTKYFQNWQKKRIKTLGIGIQCGDEIKKLCLGVGEGIDDVATLPDTFAGILKKEIQERMKSRG